MGKAEQQPVAGMPDSNNINTRSAIASEGSRCPVPGAPLKNCKEISTASACPAVEPDEASAQEDQSKKAEHNCPGVSWKCNNGLENYVIRPEPFDDPQKPFAKYKPVYCTACAKGRRLRAEQEATEATALRSYLLRQSNLPHLGVFEHASLESFERTTNGTTAWFGAVKDWVANLNPGSSQGLVLYGGYGVGKTGLMTAALKELLLTGRVRSVFYITVFDFVVQIGEAWAERAGREHRLFRTMCEAEILFLDEVGTGHTSIKEFGDNTPLGRLFGVLDYRYRQGKPLVVATNCETPHELMEIIGQQNFNRIYETCTGLLCVGQNLRG